MSEYGGQSPGWRDPYDPYRQQQPAYGQASSGWQDPYAGQGYGYGPPGVPAGRGASNGSAIGALICNIVMTLTCCGFLAIPGIVTAAIAMGRVQSDPESARNLTIWSWVIFAINLVIVVAIAIIYVVALSATIPSSTSTP